MSLLQVAGKDEDAEQLAPWVLDQLNTLDEALLLGEDAPYEHRKIFLELAKFIFNAFDAGNVPPIRVMQAGENGAPLVYDPADAHGAAAVAPAEVPHNAVLLMQSHGYFRVVANTSGRPWSAVLWQLGLSPDKPKDERYAEWLLHCIRAAKSVKLTACTQDGEQHRHEWKRGEQLRLEQARELNESSALTQARALADGQTVVDYFWAALEQYPSVADLGREPSDDQTHVHSVGVGLDEGTLPGKLHIRDGRITRLTVGDIVAHYEHPWCRFIEPAAARQSLKHADDLDAFAEFALQAVGLHLKGYSSMFAQFLLYLRTKEENWATLLRRAPWDIDSLYPSGNPMLRH